MPEWSGLLSLIPHWITQGLVGFFGGVLWVWLGGTLLLLVPNLCTCMNCARVCIVHVCEWCMWMVHVWRARPLLGPEETPAAPVVVGWWWGSCLAAPGLGCLTRSCVGVVAVVGLGCGCVLSVA